MYVLFLRLDPRFKLDEIHVTIVLTIAMFHIVQVAAARLILVTNYVTNVIKNLHQSRAAQGLMAQALYNVMYWRGVDIILRSHPSTLRLRLLSSSSHPLSRDFFFVLGDIVCVCVIFQEMQASARRSHQNLRQQYPQLLRNACIGSTCQSLLTP